MKLSAITINGKKSQLFITTRSSNSIQEHELNQTLIDHTPSLVGILKSSNLVIKFIKARSWHEYIKLFWNHSRITKEVKGSELLEHLGLTVPIIYETGLGIIPSKKHKYIGYYIMENLTSSGFEELSKLLKSDRLSTPVRDKIMLSVFNGLKVMRDNRIVFSDFHLNNVFANSEGEITWIDPGVTTYQQLNYKKFCEKYDHSIRRYLRYEYEGKDLLSKDEKAMFNSLLVTSH